VLPVQLVDSVSPHLHRLDDAFVNKPGQATADADLGTSRNLLGDLASVRGLPVATRTARTGPSRVGVTARVGSARFTIRKYSNRSYLIDDGSASRSTHIAEVGVMGNGSTRTPRGLRLPHRRHVRHHREGAGRGGSRTDAAPDVSYVTVGAAPYGWWLSASGARYEEMWAQDVAATFDYAAASSSDSSEPAVPPAEVSSLT
jgi:hypothetical protein